MNGSDENTVETLPRDQKGYQVYKRRVATDCIQTVVKKMKKILKHDQETKPKIPCGRRRN